MIIKQKTAFQRYIVPLEAKRKPPLGARIVVKEKNHRKVVFQLSASTEIRTPVLTLKGSRPGPLDDGGNNERDFTK